MAKTCRPKRVYRSAIATKTASKIATHTPGGKINHFCPGPSVRSRLFSHVDGAMTIV